MSDACTSSHLHPQGEPHETTPLILESAASYDARTRRRQEKSPVHCIKHSDDAEDLDSENDYKDSEGLSCKKTPLSNDSAVWSSSSASTHEDHPYSGFDNLFGVSLTLENSGSVARDHLASERTFLAYMRTSLAISSTGVALVQIFSISSSTQDLIGRSSLIRAFILPLGAVTVLMGLVVLIIGVRRYFVVQSALTKGQYPVARFSPGAIAIALTALVTVTFAVLASGQFDPMGGP